MSLAIESYQLSDRDHTHIQADTERIPGLAFDSPGEQEAPRDRVGEETSQFHGGQDPPGNAVEDSRPTRQYQTALLISAFLMIFQVIGINSVYGVFQVRERHTFIEDSALISD